MKLKDLKKGEFFMKTPKTDHPKEAQVWIRGDYDRSTKTYECTNFGDMNRTCQMKGSSNVYIDFVF